MSKEQYTLKEPIELGKIVITEFSIETRPKAKFHRAISKPVPTEVDEAGGKMIMQLNIDGDLFDLISAMTGQPDNVIDELGIEDYNYVRGLAEKMAANFPNALVPQKFE